MTFRESGYDMFFRRPLAGGRYTNAASYQSLFEDESIDTINIINEAVRNNKIESMSFEKLTSGQMAVTTILTIGNKGSGNYIEDDGGNVRTLMYKNGIPQLLIGNATSS